MSEEDKEWIVIQRDYGVSPAKITIERVVAPEDEIWEVIEESFANTNTQEWVMTEEEFVKLKRKINRFGHELSKKGEE